VAFDHLDQRSPPAVVFYRHFHDALEVVIEERFDRVSHLLLGCR
jgi:hypothetical protein